MNRSIRIEVCVDSVESAMISQQAGAHRIELCSNLPEGGTTPSAATIEYARKNLKIGLNVMIRPRGGDFLYNATEREIMKKDILTAKELGADGVVFGALNPDGTIDVELIQEFVNIARPMSVTFHRAFDLCIDPYMGLETLIDLGFDRILTSGQKNKAAEGVELISKLISIAKDQIIIMPGSGINELNFTIIMQACNAREYHISCRSERESKMSFRRDGVMMGGMSGYNEYKQKITDFHKIKSIISSINN